MSRYDVFLDQFKPKQPPERSTHLLNGHFLYYLNTTPGSKQAAPAARRLIADFSHLDLEYTAVYSKFHNTINKHKDYKKHSDDRENKWQDLQVWAQGAVPFGKKASQPPPTSAQPTPAPPTLVLPTSEPPNSSPPTSTPTTSTPTTSAQSTRKRKSTISISPPQNPEPPSVLLPPSTPKSSQRTPHLPTRSSIAPSCHRCDLNIEHVRRLSERNKRLRGNIQKFRPRYVKNSVLGQALFRKNAIEKRLREENKRLKSSQQKCVCTNTNSVSEASKLECATTQLRDSNNRLKKVEKNLVSTKAALKDLEKKFKLLSKEIKDLEIANDDLVCQLTEPQIPDEIEPEPRKFDYKCRKDIYAALHGNVPIAKAPAVIKQILENHNIDSRVPSKSTVGRCASEISVLNIIHATDVYLNNPHATFSWDSTGLEGRHVNCVYVCLKKQTLTLSIAPLAGSSTMDYVCHLTEVIDQMATVYGSYTNEDPVGIKKELIEKITSTLADRVATNHCVTEKLKEIWEIDIVELNCNVHCLDGFASAVRKVLKLLDAEMGLSAGKWECAAQQLIAGLAYLRTKEKGDPVGFSTFMKNNDIKPTDFLRYVGNRFHVMFLMAGVVTLHKDEIEDYLKRFCRTEIRKSLSPLVADKGLMLQMRALGLVGKLITGPWMTVFYKNELKLSNLQLVPTIKRFRKQLDKLINDPLSILSRDLDLFGRPVVADKILEALQGDEDLTTRDKWTLMTCIDPILQAIAKVADRQLKRYLTGDLSKVSDETLEKCSAAAPHNIWAERVLGMVDAYWRRGKQTTIEFIESKVMSNTNHTLEWLNQLPPSHQEELINFAIPWGAKLTKENRRRNRRIKEQQLQKQIELGQKRDAQKRKEVQKEIRAAMETGDSSIIFDHQLAEGKDPALLNLAARIVEGDDIRDTRLLHKWEEPDGSDQVYCGLVMRMKKKKGKSKMKTYSVGYWIPSDGDGGAVPDITDHLCSSIDADWLLVDILLGDCTLPS